MCVCSSSARPAGLEPCGAGSFVGYLEIVPQLGKQEICRQEGGKMGGKCPFQVIVKTHTILSEIIRKMSLLVAFHSLTTPIGDHLNFDNQFHVSLFYSGKISRKTASMKPLI